ncbi:hypothetical protein ACFLTY_04200 [Chloroflexota bacterium]
MNGRKWLILLLTIVTVMSLATYTGVTRSLFVDDEQSTDDALGIRWGLFTLNEDFEGTGAAWDDYWDENGTTTWVQDTTKPHGGSYDAYSDLNSNGYLTTDEIEASTADNITVSFWFNTKAVEAGDLLVQRYDGTAYVTWYDITSHPSYVNNAWCEFSEVITDSQYLIAGFRLRFDTTGLVDTNEEANIDDVIIATDTIPPAAPTGLATTPGNEQISLTWDSNNETDLWGYNVYCGPTSGNYTQINASVVISSNYTDTPLYGGGTYYYAVTAVDLGNNESGYSDEASDTAVDIAPAVPTGLTANQSEFQVSLDWNDNIETDLEGYNIYRGLTSGNYTQIETLWTSSNYTDTGLTNGTAYYYAVTATDNGTNESGYSNEASDTPVDVAPAAPTGLATTPGNEQVSLEWLDNTEPDLAGYNVYRGPSSGNYTQIETLWTSSNYTDTPLYGGGTYYYAVTAVDLADPTAYESDNSDEASDTAADIAPAVPTGLTATAGNEQISLDWDDNNIEDDLWGYNIYRGPSSGNYTQIETLWTSSNYTDTPLYGGGTYYYVVTAVDEGTNESGDSDEASDTAADIAPEAPTGLGATPGDEQITLNWNDNIETDLEGYNIYRGLSSGNYTKIESLWTSSNYTDTGLVFDTYYYVVTATDNGTNESGYLSEVSTTPNDIPPAAPTGLGAIAGDFQVSLEWLDNTEPDLAGYNVYRGLTSGNYTQVNVGLVATSNYTDIGLTNGTTYYYVVRAVDWADPVAHESDNSNEASATPAIPPLTLLDDGFEGDPWDANWDGNGTTDWTHSGVYIRSGSWAALAGAGDTYLTTDDLDTSTGDNITISFWFRIKSLTKGPLYVQTYNGTSYITQHDLFVYPGVVATGTYYKYSESITDSQYLRSDFHVRFDASIVSTNVFIDDVLITMGSYPPAAPTGLVATQGDTEISLDWNDNTEGDLASYNVYRGLSSGNYTQIETLWASSNYTDTGLTNEVTYYYVVTAVDLGSNESGYSNGDSATPTDLPPAAPTGLVATPGENQIVLDWNDNTDYDLDGYNIYRGLTSGNYTQIESLWASSNYTDTGLTNGITYYYAVTAVDLTSNESGYSDEASTAPVDLPPTAPTLLVATPGDTEVFLDWNDNSEGDLAGYNIYRSLTSGNYTTPIQSLWASSNYTDTGRTNGVKYYYVVRAEDDGTNESGNSNQVNAVPGNAPPAKPTGLVATGGDEEISLVWNDNTEPDLEGYNIYRGLSSGNYTEMIETLWASSNYTDAPLYGGTYYYVVTAVDNVTNESGYSNEYSATATDTAPAAPTILVATEGDEQITLDWADNTEGDLAGYNIYRRLASGNYTQIETLWASSNYTDTGLTNGVTYYYAVKAVDEGSNESGYSDEDSARPVAPPQTLLDDNFEGSPWYDNWDDNFTTDWQLGAGYNSTNSAEHVSGDTYLTSDDLDASGVDNITVSFWFNIKLLNRGPLYIQTYNGTAYNNWYDLVTYPGVVKNTWIQFSQTITDSQYFKSNFRIRFDGSILTTDCRIDDVLVETNQ